MIAGARILGVTEYQPPAAAHGIAPDAAHGDPHATAHAVAYDAVVLAGGAARRLGGADKPAVRVGGRPLLDRVLAACADARTTVVVAGPPPRARSPGPARTRRAAALAALDAGLRHVTAEHVVLLSADLPFLDARTVAALLDALRRGTADGVLLTDADGRDQPLVAAYRVSSLRRELAALSAGHGGTAGLPCAGSPVPSTFSASPTRWRPSTATPGTTSPLPGHASGSMDTCWTNGSPQSRTNWASTWTSTPACCSTSPVTPPTGWHGRRPADHLPGRLRGSAGGR